MSGPNLKPVVQLVIDPQVAEGEIWIGGVQVLSKPSDEELGRAVRTKLVRVATEEAAKELGQQLRDDGFEVEHEIRNRSKERR